LRDAKLVEVPSELKDQPVIHRGDGDVPAPMTVKEISSAGYVQVWDSRTGREAPVLYYMLPTKLRERRQDGSFIWTTNDPKVRPPRGQHRCFLHKDGPNRKLYDSMGLRTCKKDNIINAFEAKQHMLKKHPKEWAAIEEIRKDKEREEDRGLQRAILSKMGGEIKQEIVDASKKLSRPELMEGQFNSIANGAFHRISEEVRQKHGKENPDETFGKFQDWLYKTVDKI
ncbi:MAG: hypothetical protein KKE05_00655, partial [Nanoarchaeota archaeon]|nr:hypothetical protein [Nanoarchaeota archaeon]